MDLQKRYTEMSMKTGNLLYATVQSLKGEELSQLSLPEIESMVDKIAQMIPAGNVPGMILSGLARLPGRRLPQKTVKRDINLLFKSVEQTLDKAVYGAFFAGPAAVIWGYQNMLRLSGKDPEDAFPEGPWQFYVDYAMREDTARHANETHGFDTALNGHQVSLTKTDRITAWVMAAAQCLRQYDSLLANEWRERVYTYQLIEATKNEPYAARYAGIYRAWERQRPYGRTARALADEDYPDFRRRTFDQFLAKNTSDLPAAVHDQWLAQVSQIEAQDLAPFQEQMSILAFLDAGPYGESRVRFHLSEAQIAVVYQGNYYLIPVCKAGTSQPRSVRDIKAEIAALTAIAPSQSAPLTALAKLKRANWPTLRAKLNKDVVEQLRLLRLAPIILNFDRQSRSLPLSELRLAERGVGDHALTVFDTGETFVFDQSHIFFDGAWGAALAEILSQEALAWGTYLNTTSAAEAAAESSLKVLTFDFQPSEAELINRAPRVTLEAAAETDTISLKPILELRRLFKQRSDLLRLTVNDLLILYRAIHANTYRPDPALLSTLERLKLETSTRQAATNAYDALIEEASINPAIVMPVDASRRVPRDRLHPVTFEVPLTDLNIIELHAKVMIALSTYKATGGDRSDTYAEFDHLQREYLATLARFGEVLDKIKELAVAGESSSMGALKLLAHLPTPFQRILDKVPGRFDVLNDLIKGREAFSNVGAVVPASTLTRFISAKDDNDKKSLIWGAITDAQGVMRLSLRDFRPHVGLLMACGQGELASRISQHYLNAYANGFNSFIQELSQIAKASRETRLYKP